MKQTAVRCSALAVSLVFALLLSGCAQTVVGKWKGSAVASTGGQQVSGEAVIEFTKDGTFTQDGTTQAIGQRFRTQANGTYSTEGDKLTLTIQDVKVNDRSMIAMVKSMPNAAKNLTSTVTYKIQGDTLELSQDGRTQKLEKIKE